MKSQIADSDRVAGHLTGDGTLVDGAGRAATPEPSSLQLFGSGVLGLSGLLRKQLVTRS